MLHRVKSNGWTIAALLLANLSLLLPPAQPLRVAGALLLIGWLPGAGWVNRFISFLSPLQRLVAAVALSYIFTSLTVLLLHYQPGPVELRPLLFVLNLLALLPLVLPDTRGHRPPPSDEGGQNSLGEGVSPSTAGGDRPPPSEKGGQNLLGEGLSPSTVGGLRPPPSLLKRLLVPKLQFGNQKAAIIHYSGLALILGLALFLRGAYLGYSEFQGDEALVMISAAEALEGHEDALFLRSKGPGEVLLPMAFWRLSGTTNEAISRLPFTLASIWAIMIVYLIGERLGGQYLGTVAAGFFAFNGFMVAFGRIVQYQALVVGFSALAFLLMVEWRLRGAQRLAWASGLCLGGGLLAHYDAILVLPALAWLLIPPELTRANLSPFRRSLQAAGGFTLAFLAVILPFYGPYSRDPQAGRTGEYVGGRIGDELRNNLPDFFHFNIFYSSSYYLILTGLLILILLAWQVYHLNRGVSLFLGISVLALILQPSLLQVGEGLNLAILPFALLFLGAWWVFPWASPAQALLLWLAVPFLGYNFVVALGLTHIYTTVPAWSLLAALAWTRGLEWLAQRRSWPAWLPNGLLGVGLLLALIFLGNAFLRHSVEYWQDYPAGNLPLYWTPYDEPPSAGFFGFAHRTGWKAVGQKIVTGELAGDYGSNEEPDVTTWYTRGAPRACDPQPEFYFLADDLIDPVAIPAELIETNYKQVALAPLPNGKQMRIMQRLPASLAWGSMDEAGLAAAFDRTAISSAFARSARGALPVEANFKNVVRLIGYDLDLQRAHPGGRIPVTLYWQALGPIPASYQVFTHLEGSAGPVAQADGIPVCWSYPTDLWRPGQIIADQHAILLAQDLPPGDYSLEVGLYLPENLERLDILDEAGNPAGTSLKLVMVNVRPQDGESR